MVSGDWRLTLKRTNRETNECTSVKYDDSAQKIFMAENGHVFGLTGQAGTSGWKYTDDLLYELVKDIHKEHLTLEQNLNCNITNHVTNKIITVTGNHTLCKVFIITIE